MINRVKSFLRIGGSPINSGEIVEPAKCVKLNIDSLRKHLSVIAANQTITAQNVDCTVESIRATAEILVWGDRHDSSIFDLFLEKQILSHFLRLIQQRNANPQISLQVLQFLHIFLENIKNDNAILYILSNNYVNSVINNEFDFENEEILSAYIAFLKVISFKLNANTTHLLHDKKFKEFPLYRQAVRFLDNPDRMVRITVRGILLNIFAATGKSIVHFISESTLSLHLYNMIQRLICEVSEINKLVLSIQSSENLCAKQLIVDKLNDHIDMLQYFYDMFAVKSDCLTWILSEKLHTCLLKWTYLPNICTYDRVVNPRKTSILRGLASLFLSLYIVHVENDASISRFVDTLCYVPHPASSSTGAALCAAIIHSDNVTDDDKSACEYSLYPSAYIYHALDCKYGDHLPLQTLALISVLNPSHAVIFPWCRQVVIELCRILLYSCVPDNRVRPITSLFAAWVLLKNIDYVASCTQAKEIIVQCEKLSKVALRRYLQSKSAANLVEIFENEQIVEKSLTSKEMPIRMDDIFMLVDPMKIQSFTKISFSYRLPRNPLEFARRSARVFHIIRYIWMSVNPQTAADKSLPLTKIHQHQWSAGDIYRIPVKSIVCAAALISAEQSMTRYFKSESECFLILYRNDVLVVKPHPSELDQAIVIHAFLVSDIHVDFEKKSVSSSVMRLTHVAENPHNVSEGKNPKRFSERLDHNAETILLRFEDLDRSKSVIDWIRAAQLRNSQKKLDQLTKLLENKEPGDLKRNARSPAALR